eukprot:79612-Rhodomonas_salina.2
MPGITCAMSRARCHVRDVTCVRYAALCRCRTHDSACARVESLCAWRLRDARCHPCRISHAGYLEARV